MGVVNLNFVHNEVLRNKMEAGQKQPGVFFTLQWKIILFFVELFVNKVDYKKKNRE